MVRDYLLALVVIGAAAPFMSVATRSQSPSNLTAPGNQSGSAQPSVQSLDPAAVVFATAAGLVLHAIKPGSVADYEAAIVALQDALSKSTDEEVREVASGWRVWKAAEPDGKANVIYVHLLQPASAGVDYRPSLWLDRLLAGAPSDLLAKYRDSFAVPPSMLSLTEFANMSVAPTVRGNATPAKPGNGSPQ